MPEKAADTINFLKILFHQCRTEAESVLRGDRIVTPWAAVDIEKYNPMLTALQINSWQVATAAQNIHKNAKTLLQDGKKWENILSNLEADIRLTNRPEQDASREALHLKHNCRELLHLLTILRQQKAVLIEAAEIILKHLSLANLLNVASAVVDTSKKNNEIFNEGLRVFRLVTDNRELMASDLNIHRLTIKAEKLEAALQEIQLPGIPELAKVVLQCQIDICHSAINEIHLYLGSISRTLVPEMRKIKEIEEELHHVHDKSIPETLEALDRNAGKLRRHIGEFEYKSQFIKDARVISILLENLAVFIDVFRDSYLPHLAGKIDKSGSSLNPYMFAEETTSSYFHGLKGLFRLIRLLFFSRCKNGPVNEQTLTAKISIALTSCPYYYCKDEKQAAKIADFIDSLIDGYEKPYPHDDFFQLIKNAIEAYGSLIEKNFSHFETGDKTAAQDETGGTAATSALGGLPLGRLIGKIEVRTVQLNSLQPQNTSPTAK
ncbi:MAG: hypothetical protein BM485_04910 [Desulfobulbaceae bacterium DB1]|nr:MAG: hypothetical protein BM485_04910 [Desulfobulbaceae bacterium DB1]